MGNGLCAAAVSFFFAVGARGIYLRMLDRAMEGPILTNLPSTKVNETHWKWVYRCENCTGQLGWCWVTTFADWWTC